MQLPSLLPPSPVTSHPRPHPKTDAKSVKPTCGAVAPLSEELVSPQQVVLDAIGAERRLLGGGQRVGNGPQLFAVTVEGNWKQCNHRNVMPSKSTNTCFQKQQQQFAMPALVQASSSCIYSM